MMAQTFTHPRLIERLLDPAAYPHPVDQVELLETHISWVLLTGQFAYKIKKPIKLDFLDFSTLQLRQHLCAEELRLNKHFAPQLYIDVVAITGSEDQPEIGGDGEPIEYAVRMHEFEQDQQLDRQQLADKLEYEDMLDLAHSVNDYHQRAASAGPDSPYGRPEGIQKTVLDNFHLLRETAADVEPELREFLAAWCGEAFQRLMPQLELRREQGRIRECHGDLHLSNLVRLADGIRAFDCIEFNPMLRWLDVVSDVAFLVMDLLVRDRQDLAYTFFNAWLEENGDYQSLRLLDYYLVYRSTVRAKVAALRLAQSEVAEDERRIQQQKLIKHLDLARCFTEAGQPLLILMNGLSGSGKTWLSQRLVGLLPAIRVRSDLERKRLAGLKADEFIGSGIGSGLYSKPMTTRTYQRLAEAAREILGCGRHAIIDAAFLRKTERSEFIRLARSAGHRSIIVSCTADRNLLEERLERRKAANNDASDADVAVMEYQLTVAEPLTVTELGRALLIDTGQPMDYQQIGDSILSSPD